MDFNFLKKIKKKVVAIVILNAVVLNNGIFFTKAIDQNATIPKFQCKIQQAMFNDSYTRIVRCPIDYAAKVEITMKDEELNCKFLHLPLSEKFEERCNRIFAVLIDSKKGPVDCKFLDEDQKCILTAPYHSDILSIHLYIQNENDEDFVLHDENFLCKTKFVPAAENMIFKEKKSDFVNVYNEEGVMFERQELEKIGIDHLPSVFTRYTPNFYAMGEWASLTTDFIAVLNFPDGKNDEVPYEDRVFPICTFSTDTKGDNVVPSSYSKIDEYGDEEFYLEHYINFKLPKDVNEFFIDVYSADTIKCSDGEKFIFESFRIRLDKK